MSFLLRAALVIGVLSYLAAARQGSAPVLETAALRPAVEMTTGSLAALAALPPETREAAARAGTEALSRQLTGARPSADTLLPGDRVPAWRGAAPF